MFCFPGITNISTWYNHVWVPENLCEVFFFATWFLLDSIPCLQIEDVADGAVKPPPNKIPIFFFGTHETWVQWCGESSYWYAQTCLNLNDCNYVLRLYLFERRKFNYKIGWNVLPVVQLLFLSCVVELAVPVLNLGTWLICLLGDILFDSSGVRQIQKSILLSHSPACRSPFSSFILLWMFTVDRWLLSLWMCSMFLRDVLICVIWHQTPSVYQDGTCSILIPH